MQHCQCVHDSTALQLPRDFIETRAHAWLDTFKLQFGCGCEEFFKEDLRIHFDAVLRIGEIPSEYNQTQAILLCLNPTYARDFFDENHNITHRQLFHALLRNKFAQLCDELLTCEIALRVGFYCEQISYIVPISESLSKTSLEDFQSHAASMSQQQRNALLYTLAVVSIGFLNRFST